MLRKSVLSNLVFFVDLAREEALAQRAVRDEADPEFLEGRHHFLLRALRTTASIRSGAP